MSKIITKSSARPILERMTTVLQFKNWTGLSIQELIEAGRLVTFADIDTITSDIFPANSVEEIMINRDIARRICVRFDIPHNL
jgi:hypothetical protein